MAIYQPTAAFSSISGALTKINKKSPHAVDQRMVLANHRVAPTKTVGGCNRLYIRTLENITRSTEPTANEVANKAKFTQVAAQVRARLVKSSASYATDYAAFLAQKATGEPTFRSYLWKTIKAEMEG